MHSAIPSSGRLRAAAPFLAAAAALAVFASTGPRLRAARRARNPAPASAVFAPRAADARASALVGFASVALGGFRGVLADALWLRAGRMQDERRFVELVQLSDWVTELEPTNEEVWIFHAWNMAYNVSFLLSRADDRWRWVENGLSLLRDRGIPLNPRSAELKQTLGWFFLHKVGMPDDDRSPHYRTVWAREVGSFLGPDGSAPAAGSFAEAELAEELRMDAGVMRDLEDRLGPIDWRVPAASALYWGWLGTEDDPEGGGSLPCRRIVYQSLMEMARGAGRLVVPPGGEDWSFDGAVRPNPALGPGAVAYTEECLAASDFAGIRFAYVFFLHDLTAIALLEGREEDAQAFRGRLADFFADFGLADRVPPLESFAEADPDLFPRLLEEAGFR